MSTASSSRRAVALAVVLVLATPLFAGVAAADERAGGTIVVEEGETVTGGLQAAGGTVVVHGTVEGDLQAFAGSVDVTESGTVTGSVQGAAGSITIAGTVEGDVEAAAGSLDVTETGVVRGDVEAGAGSFRLAGTVDGTVRVGAESITLASTASVGGDFVYDGELTRADGATVGGELREDPDLAVSPFPGLPSIADWVFTAYSLLLTLVVGALLLVAFPGTSAAVASGPQETPARSLGAGFLVLVGAPMLAVLLFLTIVGIPLGLLAILAYVVLLLVAFVWGEYAVGAWLLSLADREHRWLALVVGVLAVFLVSYVPVLGGLVEFAVLLFGLGGVATVGYRWVRGRRGDQDADEPGSGDGDQPGDGDATEPTA